MSGKGLLRNGERLKQPVHVYRPSFAECIGTVAAPAPLAWARANPRFDGIHDDVSSRPNKLLFVLNPFVAEAIAEEMGDAPVLQACSPREATVELAHPVRQSEFGG